MPRLAIESEALFTFQTQRQVHLSRRTVMEGPNLIPVFQLIKQHNRKSLSSSITIFTLNLGQPLTSQHPNTGGPQLADVPATRMDRLF